MRAVILAAGIGRRMAPVTDAMPKCLMRFGGRSLLARYLDGLQYAGIDAVSIVVGYRRDQIMDEAAAVAPSVPVRWIVNEAFHRGSVYSLWMARSDCDGDMLVMDADVLFPKVFLTRLLESAHRNAVLVDQSVTQRDEEMMVVARDGRVRALTKAVPAGTMPCGEGVGLLKIAGASATYLDEALQPYVASGNLDIEYEDALGTFFDRVEVGYETIGGLPWIEIDCAADRDRAEADVLPRVIRLDAMINAPAT